MKNQGVFRFSYLTIDGFCSIIWSLKKGETMKKIKNSITALTVASGLVLSQSSLASAVTIEPPNMAFEEITPIADGINNLMFYEQLFNTPEEAEATRIEKDVEFRASGFKIINSSITPVEAGESETGYLYKLTMTMELDLKYETNGDLDLILSEEATEPTKPNKPNESNSSNNANPQVLPKTGDNIETLASISLLSLSSFILLGKTRKRN